jgi:hypothetical protein
MPVEAWPGETRSNLGHQWRFHVQEVLANRHLVC